MLVLIRTSSVDRNTALRSAAFTAKIAIRKGDNYIIHTCLSCPKDKLWFCFVWAYVKVVIKEGSSHVKENVSRVHIAKCHVASKVSARYI